MFPKPLVFVDIETTGTALGHSRIIELAALRIENNQIVEEFQSLVDPEIYIDRFITSLTGITNDDVRSSPVFPLVFKQCKHLFDDAIFVAHNVSFDYNFIKYELSQIGYNFSLPKLCTVRLARKLYPQYQSHSLEKLIERHHISIAAHHRAMDDVKATWAWWQIAHTEHDESKIFIHIQSQLHKQVSLSQLDPGQVSALPTSCGVYIFYNRDGLPLYVGKSLSIQERVKSHLASQHLNKTDFKLATQAATIKGIPTAGELSALLLESQLVKELQPLYNRKLRNKKRLYIAYEIKKNNYKTVNLVLEKNLDLSKNNILGIYSSKKAFADFAHDLATKHKLCKNLLGLDKSTPCFATGLGQCKGACEGKENPTIYNLRFDMAFASSGIKPWPFSGPKVIEEYNQEFDVAANLVIDNWCIDASPADLDTYQILKTYFAKTTSF